MNNAANLVEEEIREKGSENSIDAAASQIYNGVESLFKEGVKREHYGAASLALYQRGGCSYLGFVSKDRAITENNLFDTGELTGALITTTVIAALASAGHLHFDDKVCKYIEGFGILGKEKIRIRNLLSHTSGLRDSGHLLTALMDEACVSRATIKLKILNQINGMVPEAARVEYANLNYIILGYLIENLLGDNLGEIFQKILGFPLNLHGSHLKLSGGTDVAHGRFGFKDSKPIAKTRFISSGVCHKRGPLQGESFDFLTAKMGGVSGAGGYFANYRDISKILDEYQLGLAKKSSILASPVLYDMMGFPSVAQKKSSEKILFNGCLGWAPSGKIGYLGNLIDRLSLSKFSFAMQSSTGCFVALDPERQTQVIFLSNGLGSFAWPKASVCPISNRMNLRRFLRLDPKWRTLEVRHDSRKFRFVQELLDSLIVASSKRTSPQ